MPTQLKEIDMQIIKWALWALGLSGKPYVMND